MSLIRISHSLLCLVYHELLPRLLQVALLLLLIDFDAAIQVDQEVGPCKYSSTMLWR